MTTLPHLTLLEPLRFLVVIVVTSCHVFPNQNGMYIYRKLPNVNFSCVYASLNTTLSPETATDSNDPKADNPPTKIYRL
jgi:hypothetical protein